jgi:diguanylate cyclase (GGDEF)-like protein
MSISVQHEKDQQSKQDRADTDLSRRMSLGISVYFFGWTAIAYGNDMHRLLPELTLSISMVFAIIAIYRYAFLQRSERIRARNRNQWFVLTAVATLTPAAIWGGIMAFLFFIPELETVKMFMVVGAAALGTGGTSTFAPDFKLGCFYLLAVAGPAAAVNLFGPMANLTWALLFLIYLAFTIAFSRRQNQEYWQALNNEIKLQHQQILLQQLNQRDSLTGIYNRGFFDEILEKEWHRANREQSRLALLVIDVDYFKKVNDSYGHLTGDQCLRKIAHAIQQTAARSSDIIARYGGEEFAVLLPKTTLKSARLVAEKIRQSVKKVLFEHKGNQFSVTVSIGIAAVENAEGKNASSLFELADNALYQAKLRGRDRVV